MNKPKLKTTFLLIVSVFLLNACGTSDSISKAEFVAMVSDYFEWPHPDDYNDIWKMPIDGFNDVSSADLYGKQIEVALEQGIITKDASGNFNPDAAMTRGEAAKILQVAFMLDDLVAEGFMEEGKTNASLSKEEAAAVFEKIITSVVAPVQAVPVTTAVAPRRYIKLWCPTEGAAIYFTRDGSEPTMESEVYNLEQMGHIAEMIGFRDGSGSSTGLREVVYKAFAVKDGLEKSATHILKWNLYRPLDDEFQSDLIVEGDEKTPKVYRVYNDSESVRAMCWYIEGPEKGIVFDALQTTVDKHNLKDYIDKIATKPYILVVGHEHGDHDAQMPAFLNAGIETYLNKRGWASVGRVGGFGAVVTDPEKQKLVKDVEEGDSFDLGGGCVFDVYAMPGHANGNIVLNDKQSGMVFGSDIYSCTRAGSADNVGVSGLKVDRLLSFTQQTYSNYTKDGRDVKMLFTGHDEQMLSNNNLLLFEQALQQVIDKGEAGCSPSLRGRGSRVTTIGDMWKDGTDWISLSIGGMLGDDYEYLTSNSTANYNAGGFIKYSVLSNIEIDGGDLVGTTVEWADPRSFEWAGKKLTVPNSLTDKFDPWTYNYTIKVPAENNKISITPVTMSTQVKEILLDGKLVEYRSENEVEVSNGQVIDIIVTAPDGETKSTYLFTIESV
nr:cadherin-like beta sandwich domain-containing protein [uncultured Draconibacterium sp.]